MRPRRIGESSTEPRTPGSGKADLANIRRNKQSPGALQQVARPRRFRSETASGLRTLRPCDERATASPSFDRSALPTGLNSRPSGGGARYCGNYHRSGQTIQSAGVDPTGRDAHAESGRRTATGTCRSHRTVTGPSRRPRRRPRGSVRPHLVVSHRSRAVHEVGPRRWRHDASRYWSASAT